MYKKRALFLALIVLSAGSATAGELAVEPSTQPPTGPMQVFFTEPVQPCSSALSRDELATPSLLQAFYAERGHVPVWQSPQQRTVLADTLSQLVDDGLDPAHYPLPDPLIDPLCADLLTSRSYLRALQHLSRGKVEQERGASLAGQTQPSPVPSRFVEHDPIVRLSRPVSLPDDFRRLEHDVSTAEPAGRACIIRARARSFARR